MITTVQATCKSSWLSISTRRGFEVQATGEFEDTLVLQAGTWRIARRVGKIDSGLWSGDPAAASEGTYWPDGTVEELTPAPSVPGTHGLAQRQIIVEIRHILELFWFLVNSGDEAGYLSLYDDDTQTQSTAADLFQRITRSFERGYGLNTFVNVLSEDRAVTVHTFIIAQTNTNVLKINNIGFCRDELRKVNGVWKISARMVYLDQDMKPREPFEQQPDAPLQYSTAALSLPATINLWRAKKLMTRTVVHLDNQDNYKLKDEFAEEGMFLLKGTDSTDPLHSIERLQVEQFGGRARTFLGSFTPMPNGFHGVFLTIDTVGRQPRLAGSIEAMILDLDDPTSEPTLGVMQLFVDRAKAPSFKTCPFASEGQGIPKNGYRISDPIVLATKQMRDQQQQQLQQMQMQQQQEQGKWTGVLCDSTAYPAQSCPDKKPCNAATLDCATLGPQNCLCDSDTTSNAFASMRVMRPDSDMEDQKVDDSLARSSRYHYKHGYQGTRLPGARISMNQDDQEP